MDEKLRNKMMEKFIGNYKKTIDYLVNDTYDVNLRDDVRQELLLKLCEIYIVLEHKDHVVLNIDNYVFKSLFNKRTCFLKEIKKNKTLLVEDNIFDVLIKQNDKPDYCDEDFEYIQSIIHEKLNEIEKLIISKYYFENMTMAEIGTILNISQQAISKRLTSIHRKLANHMNK